MNISFQNSASIEIEEGTQLQFVKKNMLFAFDDIELERTTEFDLPATPLNNALFGLANDEHYDGAKMRQRFPIQMQAGGVTKGGYLYLSGFSEGKYKAVFVTGELLGLQAVKNAGKIADIYPYNTSIIYPYLSTEIHRADNAEQLDFDIISYVKDKGKLHPSVNLNAVLVGCLQSIGYNIVFPNRDIYRYIPDTIQEATMRPDILTREWLGELSDTREDARTINDVSSTLPELIIKGAPRLITRHPYTGYRYGYVRHFEPAFDITIRFPRDLSPLYFCVTLDDNESTDYVDGVKFHGDYELRNYTPATGVLNAIGAPLAGREISISAHTPFMFVYCPIDYAVNETQTSRTQTFTPGRFDVFTPDRDLLNINIEIASAGISDIRQPVYLRDNLPDLTVIDVAKSIAALSGTLLSWDEGAGVIRFDNADLSTFTRFDINDSVVSVSELKRTFSDFAQQNIIKFDNASNVIEPRELTYNISNVTIEREKELYRLPFSGGDGIIYENRELYYEANNFDDTDKPAVAIAGENTAVYLERCKLPRNNTIDVLCDVSTSINVVFRCPLILFETITDKTLIVYRGAEYCWTEMTFEDDLVSATLAQVRK